VKRIAVTGLGCLSSLGLGKKDNLIGLRDQKINFKKASGHEILENDYYIHKAKDFDLNNFIDRKFLNDLEIWKEGDSVKDLYYLLLSVKLALEDSQLKYDPIKNDIGIIAAHENPGIDQYILKLIDSMYAILEEPGKGKISKATLFNKLIPKFLKSTFELQSFMFLHHLSKIFSLHGYSLFINNACASGLYGIEAAAQIIKTGKCPAIVVVAADTVDFLKQVWFEKLNMYNKKGIIEPFSKNSNGFVLGEGAAAIVLEDFQFAEQRKARIYAEYLGSSFCSEGWKVTIPAVWSDFYKNVIKDSLKSSKIKSEMVDVISPHGIGVSVVDSYESEAIKKIFGPKTNQPLVVPFKPYIGHTLGANAILETVFLLLCMHNEFIPAVLNKNSFDSDLNMPRKNQKISFNIGMKSCCAFGGYMGSCIFKKVS